MKPGNLDQRITIQQPVRASDGGGGSTATWQDVATVWANVFAVSGSRETKEDGRFNAIGPTKFTIRNKTGLDETMRVVWGGEGYNIRHIMREGTRKMYLTIEADRGAADIE